MSLLPSSFPHNVFFLDKRCSKERGIKSTGEMEVLIARLELFDELGGGATKRQREEEVVVVETVGKAEGEKMLLEACKSGTLDQVLRALNVCGNPNVFNAEDESTSALMYVCWREDWNVSETIVKTLLQRGALVRVSDSKLWSALHFAARISSPGVVKLLLDTLPRDDSFIDQGTKKGSTPLSLCCERPR